MCAFAWNRLGDPSRQPHAQHPGWPENTPAVVVRSRPGALAISGGQAQGITVRLRPLRTSDGSAWRTMRVRNEHRLRPVEPTVVGSWESVHSRVGWWRFFLQNHESAQMGASIPFVIDVDGCFAGQLMIGGISRGAQSECWLGYWVDESFAGRSVATAAVALAVDHATARLQLRRVTATCLPDNEASQAVLRANGFVQEGLLRKYLHIDGAPEDHLLFSRLAEDFADSAVEFLARHGRVVADYGVG
mgnify:FL=1